MSLKRHLGGYAVVGIVQWVVEYALMVALSAWLMPVEPANIIGRFVGAVLGYWLNGRYTFAGPGRALSRAAGVRFVLMWIGLTALNTFALDQIDDRYGLQNTWLAKPLVDLLTGSVGFLLSRHWVYRH